MSVQKCWKRLLYCLIAGNNDIDIIIFYLNNEMIKYYIIKYFTKKNMCSYIYYDALYSVVKHSNRMVQIKVF